MTALKSINTPWTAPMSNGSLHIPGLGASSFAGPTPSNGAVTSASPALHPALRDLSQEQLTALLQHYQAAQAQTTSATQPPLSGDSYVPASAAPLRTLPVSGSHIARPEQIRQNGAVVSDTRYSSLEEGEVSDASMELDSPALSRPSPSSTLKRKYGQDTSVGNRKAPRMSDQEQAHNDWLGQAMRYKEQVLPFILSLHHEGFSFSDILREVQNEPVLKSIYAELGLPISKPTTVIPLSSTTLSEQSKQQATLTTDRKRADLVAGKNSPRSAAPVDRSEYLARLSQLKAAKSAATASKPATKANVASQPSAKVVAAPPEPAQAKASDSPAQIAKEKEAAQNKKLNTERLKQKLEMLKAAEQKKRELAAAQASITVHSKTSSREGSDTPKNEAPSTKKRPVASDFLVADTETPGFSRPFGQSQGNSDDDAMIIEASDDGDDDDSDDSDSEIEPATATKQSDETAITMSARRQRVADFPPLSDFPPRSPFHRQSSASHVRTSQVQTPGALSEAEALLKHEQELAMLKIRIAEAEKRKKGVPSKSSAIIDDPSSSTALPDVANAVLQQAQAALADVSTGNATPMRVGTPGLATDPDRRTQLQAKLSARDLAASAKKARLAEMQRQLELLQQEYEQDMLEQEQLRQELEAFNVDTEGMNKEQMEAKKDEIVRQLESQPEAPGSGLDPPAIAAQPLSSTSPTHALHLEPLAEDVPDEVAQVATSVTVEEPDQAAKDSFAAETSSHEMVDDVQDSSRSDTEMQDTQPAVIEPSSATKVDPADVDNSPATSDSEEMDMDIETTSDESSEESDEDASDESDSSKMSPKVSTVVQPSSQDTSDAPEVQPQSQGDLESNKDSDGDAPMDVSEDEDEDSDDESMDESSKAPTSTRAASIMETPVLSTNVSTPMPADDIAPELQYLEHPVSRTAIGELPKTTFQPYNHSILQHFKQFRSHPEYSSLAKDGFRSLTYSNNIDAHKMLCTFESAGEACKDPKCPFQHFKDMSLPDNMILLQLSKAPARPNQTSEDEQRFKDGLRNVLVELRAQGLTHLDDIARRIAQYRRDWLSNYSLGFDQHVYVPTDAN